MYNRVGWTMIRRRAIVMLLSVAAVSSDAMSLRLAMTAMACCVKAHRECARLQAPDDCCQNMGHGVVAAPSTAPDARILQFGLQLADVPPISVRTLASIIRFASESTFKRPHDPPHLHPSRS
jgi:hypothetical protein